MNKLKNIKELVKSILENDEETRNSDMLLYFRVCQIKNEGALEIPFGAVIKNLDRFYLPPFESVRRTRQKVQAECPHLAPCKKVEEFRAENEVAFREFARG